MDSVKLEFVLQWHLVNTSTELLLEVQGYDCYVVVQVSTISLRNFLQFGEGQSIRMCCLFKSRF